MECIKVAVRCRPKSKTEREKSDESIVQVNSKIGQIVVKEKSFRFDFVYDDKTQQIELYNEIAFPLVENIFQGFNATIFAYGQTGCGKTYTMIGNNDGIIPNSFKQIFESINLRLEENTELSYLVRAAYIEIYNEELRDLVNEGDRLELKENEQGVVYVKNLEYRVVENEQDLQTLLKEGDKNRSIGVTKMNSSSSRSHSIFTIILETSEKLDEQTHYKVAKLNLVDLAGSERQTKTGATGQRLVEGCKINLSLSSLGNVISALVDNAKGGKRYVPYRDSKLTRLLQDSLGGNTKTVMISNISPIASSYDETLSTLRYADRAKRIKNLPVVNEDPKDALLRKYQTEIKELQQQLTNGVPDKLKSELEERIVTQEKEKQEMQLQLQRLKSQVFHLNQTQSNSTNADVKKARRERETQLEKIAIVRKEEMNRLENEEIKELANEFERVEAETKQKAMRALKKRLKKAAQQHKHEMEELESEHATEKEELLQSIRDQNKEIKRLEQILELLLSEEELFRLWQDSVYDDEHDFWEIPEMKFKNCRRCAQSELKLEPLPITVEQQHSVKLIEGNTEVSKLMKDLAKVKRDGFSLEPTETGSEKTLGSPRVEEPQLPKSFKTKPRRLEPL